MKKTTKSRKAWKSFEKNIIAKDAQKKLKGGEDTIGVEDIIDG